MAHGGGGDGYPGPGGSRPGGYGQGDYGQGGRGGHYGGAPGYAPPRPPQPPRPSQHRPQPGGGSGGGKRFVDYPRFGRSGWRRWVPSWKLVSAVILLFILVMVVGFVTAYSTTQIPARDQKVLAQTTIVYYEDGKHEIGRFSTENRQSITIDQMPEILQNAVLAAEDHTFRKNNGVDPTSIVRAAWSNARGNSTQGGSTITQQYVKNVYDMKERSVSRKAKEFFIALKIDREKQKDEILERYLNTIYWGRGAYGIEAASEAYFGKHAAKLNVSESAYLAGIINAPSLADPADGGDSLARAERRWGVVLDAMVKYGWLSPAERAEQHFPAKAFRSEKARNDSLGGQRGYMMYTARDEAAKKLGIPKDQVETGGYKIVTTFDQNLVIQASRAVKKQLLDVPGRPKANKKHQDIQAGVVSIDPKSGAVRAMYGGADFIKRNRNAVTEDIAEAGSTFKAFGLLGALRDGVSLHSRYDGSSPQKIQGQRIENFGNQNEGYNIDLVEATENSVNTVFVKLNSEIGPEKTKQAALDAGLPESDGLDETLTNVLGSASPHPVDLATAYATIADNGIRHSWYTVSSIAEVGTGKHLFDAPPGSESGERAFSKDVTADAMYAMQQVVQGGSGSYARALGRPVAGKTGTSTNARSAWFVGFTPQLVTAVDIYLPTADGKGALTIPTFGGATSITGGGYPTRVWTEYMQQALKGKDIVDFPDPVYGGKQEGLAPPPTQAPQPTAAATRSPEPDPEPTVTPSEAAPTPTLPFPTFGGGGDGGTGDDPGGGVPPSDPGDGGQGGGDGGGVDPGGGLDGGDG